MVRIPKKHVPFSEDEAENSRAEVGSYQANRTALARRLNVPMTNPEKQITDKTVAGQRSIDFTDLEII